MAVYEPEHDRIVVRIVYDGPGRVGKTTNIAQLAQMFGGLPNSELYLQSAPGERTELFDWFSFEGGALDGHPLVVQLVAVPGHKSFEARRARILETADVVVLVCDSSPGSRDTCREALDTLHEHLGKQAHQVPLIVQANWQDSPQALRLDELGAVLDLPGGIPILGAVASVGLGVRETALLAHRLAARPLKHHAVRANLPALAGCAGTQDELRSALLAIEPHRRVRGGSGPPPTPRPVPSAVHGKVVPAEERSDALAAAGEGVGSKGQPLAPGPRTPSLVPSALPSSSSVRMPGPPPETPSAKAPRARAPTPSVAPVNAVRSPGPGPHADTRGRREPPAHESMDEIAPARVRAAPSSPVAAMGQGGAATSAAAQHPAAPQQEAKTGSGAPAAARQDVKRSTDASVAPAVVRREAKIAGSSAAQQEVKSASSSVAPAVAQQDAKSASVAPAVAQQEARRSASSSSSQQEAKKSAALSVAPAAVQEGSSGGPTAANTSGAPTAPERGLTASTESSATTERESAASATPAAGPRAANLSVTSSSPAPAAAPAAPSVRSEPLEFEPLGGGPPLPPLRADLPYGHVWPVPGGRRVLEQVAGHPLQRVRWRVDPYREDSTFLAAGFCLRTRNAWRFSDVEEGRAALREYARRAARLGTLLPADVALALSEGEVAVLWHISPILPSFRAELRAGAGPSDLLPRLASAYVAALRLAARHGVVLSLAPQAFAMQAGEIVYVEPRLAGSEAVGTLMPWLMAPLTSFSGPARDAYVERLEAELPAALTQVEVEVLGLHRALAADASPAHGRLRAALGRCAGPVAAAAPPVAAAAPPVAAAAPPVAAGALPVAAGALPVAAARREAAAVGDEIAEAS